LTTNATCGTSTATGNNVPIVTVPANFTIPKSTPFALTGSATDADATDALTYCWEGTNTGTVAAPTATTLANTAQPPFFRSYEPSTSPTRTYPLLSAIVNGLNYAKGDKLPSVAFVTTHRMTVRDNKTGGGATAYKEVTVTVDGGSGPFLETTNLTGSFMGNSTQTITWSVNNTDGTNGSTVTVPNVKLALSTDGGQTFPTVLLATTANDGSADVTLPNINTATARIKVEAIGNIFFDISNADFTITASLPIELTQFKVETTDNNTALLTWQTASERDNVGFDIEKSLDGKTFEKIGFVKGFGTTGTPQYYSLLDNKLRQLSYYRLRQIDLDGKTAYSNTLSAQPKSKLNQIKVYPNPASTELTVELPTGAFEAQIFDVLGRLVARQSGEGSLIVNLSRYTEGVYFVQVGSQYSQFIKK
jgi:hypothetical protein